MPNNVKWDQMHQPQFVKLAAAAKILGVSRTTLYRHLRRGIIKGIQIEGLWLIPTEELERIQRTAMAAKLPILEA